MYWFFIIIIIFFSQLKKSGKTTQIMSISVVDSSRLFSDSGSRECVASHQIYFFLIVFEINLEGIAFSYFDIK